MTSLTISMTVHGDFSRVGPALRSLYTTTLQPCAIFVTINLGTAAEAEALKAEFPDIRLLQNETPEGFAANHNRVMALAQTPYIALLNDDILLHEGALDMLTGYLDDHPEVALVGPRVSYPDGKPQVSVYNDPDLLRMVYKISGLSRLTSQQSRLRRWLLRLGAGLVFKVESLKPQTAARPVPVIKGVAMVVRQDVYESVGGMDETTLAYGEEPDWHLRIRQAGGQVVFVPQAEVTHFGLGQVQLKMQGSLLIEDRKSILNYFIKHRPRWEVWVIRVAIVVFHTLWACGWWLVDRQRARNHLAAARMGLNWNR